MKIYFEGWKKRRKIIAERDHELFYTLFKISAFVGLALSINAFGIDSITKINLNLQDSSGHTRKSVEVKDFSKNIFEITRILDSSKGYINGSDENSPFEYLLGACGCDAPVDTLEIIKSNNASQVYQLYCSTAKRVSNGSSQYLIIGNKTEKFLWNRWDNIRNKYCSGSYGCDDFESRWHWFLEKLTDRGWVHETSHMTRLPDLFIQNIKENKINQPMIEMVFTIQVGDEKVKNVKIDSIDSKLKYIAKSFEKDATGSYYKWGKNKVEILKLTAYNFYYEN